MIIDSHGHTVVPDEAYKFMAELVASRANPYIAPTLTDAAVRGVAERLIKILDSVGTDVQLLSPRPYMQMHSVKPARVTQLWTRFMNDLVYRQVQMFPDRLRGVASLPQHRATSPENCLEELDRCVKQLGFVGCLLNPDPTEGDGERPPGLGDKFWYPLYAKLVELDTPALIHSASSCDPRESYTLKFINEESIAVISLLESSVFQDFPRLKIVVPHGGGAIPYHMGRFRAWTLHRKETITFDEKMRRLYFDTCNYSKEAIEFLLKVIGTDNVLFGTEKPGTGSAFDPVLKRDLDDLKPVIESIEWLSASDRGKIFEHNCRKIYTKFDAHHATHLRRTGADGQPGTLDAACTRRDDRADGTGTVMRFGVESFKADQN